MNPPNLTFSSSLLDVNFLLNCMTKDLPMANGMNPKKILLVILEMLSETYPNEWKYLFLKSSRRRLMLKMTNEMYWGKNYAKNANFLSWVYSRNPQLENGSPLSAQKLSAIYGKTCTIIGKFFLNSGSRDVLAAICIKLYQATYGKVESGRRLQCLGREIVNNGMAYLSKDKRPNWLSRITLPGHFLNRFPHALKEDQVMFD